MKTTLRFLALAALTVRLGAAPLLQSDLQLSGALNRLNAGATFTVQSGATFTNNGTINGTGTIAQASAAFAGSVILTGGNFRSNRTDNAANIQTYLQNTSTGDAVQLRLRLEAGDPSNYALLNLFGSGHATNAGEFQITNIGPIVFLTNGAERLRLSAAGVVTSPGSVRINQTNTADSMTNGLWLGTDLALYRRDANSATLTPTSGAMGFHVRATNVTGGDAYYQATVFGDHDWSWGTRKASTNFVINTGSVLGATDVFILSQAGTLTLAGNVVSSGTSGDRSVVINSVASTNRSLTFQTGGLPRWNFYTTSTAESGSSAGSNLFLSTYNDDGSYRADAMQVTRNTGAVYFPNATTIGTTAAASATGQMNVGPLPSSLRAMASISGTLSIDAVGFGPSMFGRRYNGTVVTPTAVTSGQQLLALYGAGHNGSAFVDAGAAIVFAASESWSPTANGGEIQFSTVTNGTAAAAVTRRAKITNDGNFLIGDSTSAGTIPLQVTTANGFSNALNLRTTNTISGAADQGPQILFTGHNGSAVWNSGTVKTAKENSTVGNNLSYLSFGTSDATAVREVARFSSAGNLLVGVTTDAGHKLYVSDTNSSTTIGSNEFLGIENRDITANNYSGMAFKQWSTTSTAASTQTVAAVGIVGTSHTAGSQSADLVFSTRNAGTFAERMRVSSAGNVSITGNLTVSGTTTIKGVRSVTQALDFPAISAGSSQILTVTVTGAVVGDAVNVTLADAGGPYAWETYLGWVSATNTVSVQAGNVDATAVHDPSSQNYRITVFSF